MAHRERPRHQVLLEQQVRRVLGDPDHPHALDDGVRTSGGSSRPCRPRAGTAPRPRGPAPTDARASACTCRPSPPTTTGGYSHDSISTFIAGNPRASRCPNSPSSARSCGGPGQRPLPVPRADHAGQLAEPVAVHLRPPPRVVGRRVLRDHERPVARQRQQRLPHAAGPAPGPGGRGACGGSASSSSCTRRAGGHQVRHLLAVPHPPVLAGTPRRRRQLDRRADVPGLERAAQRRHPHAGRRQRAQHRLQPRRALVPPVPEQLGVVRGDHQPGPAVPLAQRPQPGDHRGDEVLGVPGHRRGGQRPGRTAVSARGGTCLPVTRDGLEPARVVEGVEVAVGRVAGVAGLRRPDPVGDLQVAAEAHDVRVADRARRVRVAVQRRTVHQEPSHAGRRVVALHARRVAALRRPDPRRARGRAAARCRRARCAARTARTRGSSSGWNGCVAGPPSSSTTPPSTSGRSTGENPCRQRAFELRQRGAGGPVLGRGQVAQQRSSPRHRRRRVLRAQLPVAEPVVRRAQRVRVVQLRGEHRRHAQRQHVAPALGGEPSDEVDDRQVGVRPRLVEPLLADRPGAVVGEPGQMAVQHQAERALGSLMGAPPRPRCPDWTPGRRCRATKSRRGHRGDGVAQRRRATARRRRPPAPARR